MVVEDQQPLVPFSRFQSSRILPIYIAPIQIVIQHKCSQFISTIQRTQAQRCWHLFSPKSTHKDMRFTVVISLPQIGLDLLLCLPKNWVIPEVVNWFFPHTGCLCGKIPAFPETQHYVVVYLLVRETWYSQTGCQSFDRVELPHPVNIPHSYRITVSGNISFVVDLHTCNNCEYHNHNEGYFCFHVKLEWVYANIITED